MLNTFMPATLLPIFCQIHTQDSSYKHVFTSRTDNIVVPSTWFLKTELAWVQPSIFFFVNLYFVNNSYAKYLRK